MVLTSPGSTWHVHCSRLLPTLVPYSLCLHAPPYKSFSCSISNTAAILKWTLPTSDTPPPPLIHMPLCTAVSQDARCGSSASQRMFPACSAAIDQCCYGTTNRITAIHFSTTPTSPMRSEPSLSGEGYCQDYQTLGTLHQSLISYHYSLFIYD